MIASNTIAPDYSPSATTLFNNLYSQWLFVLEFIRHNDRQPPRPNSDTQHTVLTEMRSPQSPVAAWPTAQSGAHQPTIVPRLRIGHDNNAYCKYRLDQRRRIHV